MSATARQNDRRRGAVRDRVRAWVRRPDRAAPYALLLALGMLLWGRLLLKEPPRVASADEPPGAAALSATDPDAAASDHAAGLPPSEKSSTPSHSSPKSRPVSAD